MKKEIFPLLLFMFVLITISNCKKESTPDIRENYIATYMVNETWQENNITRNKPTYTMTVEKSSKYPDKVMFINFADYGSGTIVQGNVTGTDFTIPQQSLPNSKTIVGVGKMENDNLTITYTESSQNYSLSISLTAQKL